MKVGTDLLQGTGTSIVAWGRSWLLFLVLGWLVGCSHAYADPATLAATLKPDTVFAKLASADTVDNAAAQFAETLNIDPAGVRVRIKPGSCTVCSLESRPEMVSVAGIAVAEAEKIIEPNDEVSFFIPKFSCTFVYDGETLTPKQCQPSPI